MLAARTWRFAGGWAAVTDAVPDVYLAVIGLGADPDGLSLAMLQDGSAYHFDLNQPLDPSAMAASRQRAGGGALEPHRRDWHPDQLRLLRDERTRRLVIRQTGPGGTIQRTADLRMQRTG